MSREKTFREIVSGKRRGLVAALIRSFLTALSIPYGWVVQWRNRKFDRGINIVRAAVPVISIGNLTTGGTGKTPLVCYLARKLREMDLRVCILSRGYGAGDQGVNDEALELEIRLPDVPHLQNRDRARIARIACEELESEVLLLDDGFQHRQLARDVDLLVIDVTNPFGYDRLLPRGLLREPVENLGRADFVILSRFDLASRDQIQAIKKRIRAIRPEIGIAEAITDATDLIDFKENTKPVEELQGRKVMAFCGIGNPEGFRETLIQLGCELVDFREFPDHHHYSRDDIQSLHQWIQAAPDCEQVVCTHKDLVKINLGQLGGRKLDAVLISVKIQLRERELWQTIHSNMTKPP